VDLAEQLRHEASRFVDALEPLQRELAVRPLDDEERRSWAYWPMARPGVPFGVLDRAQAKLAHRLLAAALPEVPFAQAEAIMALDEVLDRREGWASDRRNRDDYWVTVFGTPSKAEPWGFRFEGHHVSVHATVLGAEVRLTPLFLGANPAEVRDHHARVVLAPLAHEERLGFELLHALSGEQRRAALIAAEAPHDIATRNASRIDAEPMPGGVPLEALDGEARRAAGQLLELYLARFPAGAQRPDATAARFAWAGAAEPGTGHYYRVSGPGLLIELDNTQDGANHVHTVVRDPRSDFGDDVLARHHRAAHS
jgi:hypothetical protein